MIGTKARSIPLLKNRLGHDMAKKSDNTRPVRLHLDVADLADKLAPIFGQSVPDFLSGLLRPVLGDMRREAAAKLLEEKPASKKKN